MECRRMLLVLLHVCFVACREEFVGLDVARTLVSAAPRLVSALCPRRDNAPSSARIVLAIGCDSLSCSLEWQDSLKHQRTDLRIAETSLGAADTSVRATSSNPEPAFLGCGLPLCGAGLHPARGF